LLSFNGAGVPSSFAAQAKSLGGTVIYSNAKAGFAYVSGLTAAAATQLGASTKAIDVQADTVVSLDTPHAATYVRGSDVAASTAQPAAAFFYSWQWDMRLIDADKAWAAGKLGSKSVTVAILDTGIDYDSPDLNGLVDLSRSTSFVPSDDAITQKYFPSRSVISDYNGHGTNVASTVSSNALVFAGVTSKTTLIGVKVLSASGRGSTGAILSGVLWAADHGADVANMSIQGSFVKAGNGRLVATINRVMAYAKQQGMLVVVAAGNSETDLDHDGNAFQDFCSATHVVCVSSVGPVIASQAFPQLTPAADQPAFYTNFGRSAIDVAAPGGNADPSFAVVSNWPWGPDIASWIWSFCSKTSIEKFTSTGVPVLSICAEGDILAGDIGTSQATPHVSGLAALLVAEKGHSNPSQIKNAIEKSAIDLGQPGTDPYYGKGRIDVARALGLN
jgi:subtilisin family serine protease